MISIHSTPYVEWHSWKMESWRTFRMFSDRYDNAAPLQTMKNPPLSCFSTFIVSSHPYFRAPKKLRNANRI